MPKRLIIIDDQINKSVEQFLLIRLPHDQTANSQRKAIRFNKGVKRVTPYDLNSMPIDGSYALKIEHTYREAANFVISSSLRNISLKMVRELGDVRNLCVVLPPNFESDPAVASFASRKSVAIRGRTAVSIVPITDEEAMIMELTGHRGSLIPKIKISRPQWLINLAGKFDEVEVRTNIWVDVDPIA